jgi:hypothetical protein
MPIFLGWARIKNPSGGQRPDVPKDGFVPSREADYQRVLTIVILTRSGLWSTDFFEPMNRIRSY